VEILVQVWHLPAEIALIFAEEKRLEKLESSVSLALGKRYKGKCATIIMAHVIVAQGRYLA
jgi:hypothetical protein